jgi:hypothetical protein
MFGNRVAKLHAELEWEKHARERLAADFYKLQWEFVVLLRHLKLEISKQPERLVVGPQTGVVNLGEKE